MQSTSRSGTVLPEPILDLLVQLCAKGAFKTLMVCGVYSNVVSIRSPETQNPNDEDTAPTAALRSW